MRGETDFLSRVFIDEANEYFQLPESVMQAFYEEIDRINADSELQQLAREMHGLLYGAEGNKEEAIGRLQRMGTEAGMFAAVVYASGLPAVKELYASKGMPMHVLKETLSDMGIWMQHHEQKYGSWGLSELGWLNRHFSGGIYKLGRLQFMPRTYRVKANVFRSRSGGRLIALSDEGVLFRADGQADGTNGVYDPAGSWASVYENDGLTIRGYRLSPYGYAIREPIELDAREWEQVLKEGDPVLDVHIPEGAKMTHELCRDSYRQAAAFFAEFLPEHAAKAFTCTSCLLSPQLRLLLPDSSNIVKFQSDYYCTPVVSDEKQTFERVFGAIPEDLSQAPRDSALRRAVLDHVMAGHAIHGGSGFIMLESAEDGRYADRADAVGKAHGAGL